MLPKVSPLVCMDCFLYMIDDFCFLELLRLGVCIKVIEWCTLSLSREWFWVVLLVN
jgi:hypothetical protein